MDDFLQHGIGSPSLSVVLHEIMKLIHHAGAEDPIFLRIGTSGGLGKNRFNYIFCNIIL